MNYEAVIGLEVHVQLKTKTKVFADVLLNTGKRQIRRYALYALGFPGRCRY